MTHTHQPAAAWTRKSLNLAASLALCAGLCAGLSGCGHSDSADGAASTDTVEMPAEEALSGVVATPAADPSATASAAPGADSADMLQGTATAAPTGDPDKD